MINERTMIHQYVWQKVKNGKRIKVGVLVGAKHNNDHVVITGSKVNLSKGDKFDRAFGNELAIDRQYAVFNGRSNKIAASFEEALEKFKVRCKKYYKIADIRVPKLSK